MELGGKGLKTILNNDDNNILYASSGNQMTPEEYRRAVEALLEARPGVLAQNVGFPDPVIYCSEVATTFDKHLVEVCLVTWPKEDPKVIREGAARQADALVKLFASGTDPLGLTVEVCRKRGVLVVASYRMNSEDCYDNTWMLSEFGRAHPEWRIPGTGALDPAIPEVYEHRMRIFREVAEKYDIDGIEFDWRRWTHMISDPLKNYPILTKIVRETRRMLDEAARRKGRERLLLGVRVGPSLADPLGTEYPGGDARVDVSCRDLGLDVKTWIEEEIVDYVCPSLFWPRWPGLPNTEEFVKLAKETRVGIYPTLFPIPKWIDEGPIEVKDRERLMRYKNELCSVALKCYEEGADGISTFNWVPHHQPGMVHDPMRKEWGLAAKKAQMYVHRILGEPEALREYMAQDICPC